MWKFIAGSTYDIPVMHNSLSTQFAAKIIKSLFPEIYPLSDKIRKLPLMVKLKQKHIPIYKFISM